MGAYVCELCRKDGKEFRVTADKTGGTVMNAHFRDKHPELNFEPVDVDAVPTKCRRCLHTAHEKGRCRGREYCGQCQQTHRCMCDEEEKS